MEVKATGKKLRVPPRKARLVAREVKGKHAVRALAELKYHPSNASYLIGKVLSSAIGNAVENENIDRDSLVITRIEVDEGWRLKRFRARAQGRANRILKRTSHITVVLEESEPYEQRRSNANPKPRPKWDTPKTKKSKKEKTEDQVAETAAEEASVVVPDEVATTEDVVAGTEEAVVTTEEAVETPAEAQEAAEVEAPAEETPAAEEEGEAEEKKEQE